LCRPGASFLTGLQVCGFEYVTKIQRMFNDIQLSDGVVDKFREYLAASEIKHPVQLFSSFTG
jgi:hypothetical protein